MVKIFLAIVCILAPLTKLKISEVQPIELLMLAILPLVTVAMMPSSCSFQSSAEIISLLKKYTLFLLGGLCVSLIALRLPVYPPYELSILKTPPFLSIARLLQIIIGIGSLILLVQLFRNRADLIRFFVRCYIYSGLLSALYGLVSVVGLYIGLEIGGATTIDSPRASGFFVEGGPFGVYLVSVALVILFRKYVLRDGSKVTMWFHLGLICLTFYAASSKAGVILILMLLMYFQMTSKKINTIFIAIIAIIVSLMLVFSPLIPEITGYIKGSVDYAIMIEEHSNDPAFAMGRITASILIPRMLVDHPVTGIGLGNYSLQRNNPEYLEGVPTTDGWDLPGLGVAGYIVELGVPLFIFLLWLVWHPVKIVAQRNVPSLVVLLASYQFFSHMLGVQITFAYPWMMTALALGYALNQSSSRKVRTQLDLERA